MFGNSLNAPEYDSPLPETNAHTQSLRRKGHRGPVYAREARVPPAARHPGKTKGEPFSRIRITHVVPAVAGRPAKFYYTHPTRNTGRGVLATKRNIARLGLQDLPFSWVSELMGK